MTTRQKDITGVRFGKLTAVKSLYRKSNGAYTWLFNCDCGNTREIEARRVSRLVNPSCGCAGGRKIDHTGEVYGKWRVVEQVGTSSRGVLWLCQCACGTVKVKPTNQLRGANSCGCLTKINVSKAKTTHGMTNTPEYRSYRCMLSRCYYKKSKDYKQYGALGVTVCDYWLESFENFYSDMGARPDGLTLDRVDSSLPYSKSNCRWATPVQQARNKRSTISISYKDVTKPLAEWADILGVSYHQLHYLIRIKKLPAETAFSNIFNNQEGKVGDEQELLGTEKTVVRGDGGSS